MPLYTKELYCGCWRAMSMVKERVPDDFASLTPMNARAIPGEDAGTLHSHHLCLTV